MRKLALATIITIVFVGSTFASNEVVLKEDKTEQQTPCRWREVITIKGKKYYGDWTYGNCNTTVHQDGTKTLQPIT